MTKMAAMPIYDKNLKKNISVMTVTYFTARSNLVTYAYGKTVKQWTFSETIVVYDINVGRYNQLNKYMQIYEYQRSRSFIDLCPNH